MKSEEYVEIVETLNGYLFKKCEEVYDLGICFEYCTNGFVDLINFLGISIWNSEDETECSAVELEMEIRNRVYKIIQQLALFS